MTEIPLGQPELCNLGTNKVTLISETKETKSFTIVGLPSIIIFRGVYYVHAINQGTEHLYLETKPVEIE